MTDKENMLDRQGVALSEREAFEAWIEAIPVSMWSAWGRREAAHAAWIFVSSRASSSRAEVEIPAVCDGKEQEAFEAWAKAGRHDMNQHPMFYLFLDKETNAARQGWKGAIEYCANVIAAAEAPNGEKRDA